MIPGFSRYEMSSDGIVYKKGTNKIMKETDGKVQLIGDDGKRGKHSVQDICPTDLEIEKSFLFEKGDEVMFIPFRSNKAIKGTVIRVFDSYNQPGNVYVSIKGENGKKYDKLIGNVKKQK